MSVSVTTVALPSTGKLEAATFETADLYLGAFLKARGEVLVGVLREGRRVTFQFVESELRARLVLEFYNDGFVRVNDFKNAIQDLKSIIYNV